MSEESAEAMPWRFEPEVFSSTKPLLSLTILGNVASVNVNRIKDILSGTFAVLDSLWPSVDSDEASSLSTVMSAPAQSPTNLPISARWIEMFLTQRVAVHVLVCGLPRGDSQDEYVVSELLKYSLAKGSHLFALFVPELEQDLKTGIELDAVRRNRLLEARRDNLAVFFALTFTDCANLLPKLSSLHQAAEKYYKDQIKRYRTKLSMALSTGVQDGSLSLFTSIRYQFKVGFMQLFLQDMSAAIKTFHSAYLQVIEYCRKLEKSEQLPIFQSLRWACDVMVYKIVWILAARGETRAATDYLVGHMAWFAPSFGELELGLAELHGWKAKLYDSKARIFSVLPQDKGEHRHAAYYCYLASKSLMSFYKSKLVDASTRLRAGHQILDWLGAAYDRYREDGLQRKTMHIGRLIATQYLAMENHEQALATLTRLRLAFHAKGWPSLLCNILQDLIFLVSDESNCLPDPKREIEYYWEYANADPSLILEDFDSNLCKLALKLSEESIVLDSSTLLSTNLLKCAVKFSRTEATVGKDQVFLVLIICNMSPLLLNLASVIIRFTDQSVPDIVTMPKQDVLPGSFLQLSKVFIPPNHGLVEIESVTIDLADLPLRFFFPSFTLSTVESDEQSTWHAVCINWEFLRELTEYSAERLSIRILPVLPKVGVSAKPLLPLIPGNICPLEIIIENLGESEIEGTLQFSGPVNDIVVVNFESGSIVSTLNDYLLKVVISSNSSITEIVHVLRQTADDIMLHLDCLSSFTLHALEAAPNYLSPDAISLANDFVFSFSQPFLVEVELLTEPTIRALDGNVAFAGHDRFALIKYIARIRVTNSMLYDVILEDVFLTAEVLKGAVVGFESNLRF